MSDSIHHAQSTVDAVLQLGAIGAWSGAVVEMGRLAVTGRDPETGSLGVSENLLKRVTLGSVAVTAGAFGPDAAESLRHAISITGQEIGKELANAVPVRIKELNATLDSLKKSLEQAPDVVHIAKATAKATATATAVVEKTKEAAPVIKPVIKQVTEYSPPELYTKAMEAARNLELRFDSLAQQKRWISQTLQDPTVASVIEQIKDKGPVFSAGLLIGASRKKIPGLLREASTLSLEGLTLAGDRVFHKPALDKLHKTLHDNRSKYAAVRLNK